MESRPTIWNTTIFMKPREQRLFYHISGKIMLFFHNLLRKFFLYFSVGKKIRTSRKIKGLLWFLYKIYLEKNVN